MKKKARILIVVIILAVLLAIAWWAHGIAPANVADKTTRLFVVQRGIGIREIANSLKTEGFINDPVVFFLLVRQLGLDSKIQAGDFRLSPSMTALEIAKNLTHGSLDIWVTIPEGKRSQEIADILKGSIPTYTETWRSGLAVHEGYLFPDTYLIPRDGTLDQIVTQMRSNFDVRFASISNLDNTALTQQEIVTIASLIEREARHAHDRPLVASVIFNRLEIGMPLQIDATVQYAIGYDLNERTWWKKGITTQDLAINSPYNTYLHSGIPPGPIASPGLDTMQAVVNPADTSYLYYISDNNGNNHYATTLQEHNANIRRFGL